MSAGERPQAGAARALSARELLSKLEGDERAELQQAMRSRDLEAVRAIIARHRDRATVRVHSARACLEPDAPTMKPRRWSGPMRPQRPQASATAPSFDGPKGAA